MEVSRGHLCAVLDYCSVLESSVVFIGAPLVYFKQDCRKNNTLASKDVLRETGGKQWGVPFCETTHSAARPPFPNRHIHPPPPPQSQSHCPSPLN